MPRSKEVRPNLACDSQRAFDDLACTYFSRSSFRTLVSSLRLNVGSPVLFVGRPTHDLARRMRDLGIELTCWTPLRNPPANNRVPSLSSHHDLPTPGQRAHEKFAAIVVVEDDALGDNLFDSRSFHLSAGLLTRLRPNGRLAFVSPSATPATPDTHPTACYARHLSFFPGVCRVTHLPNGTAETLLARLGLRPQAHFWRLVALKLPPQPIPAAMFYRLAEEAARCCRREPCHIRAPIVDSQQPLPRAA